MKVTSMRYQDEIHRKPIGEISSYFGLKKEEFICLRVGFVTADWISMKTGRSASFDEQTILNRAGAVAQLEWEAEQRQS